jgi:carboxypeptidase Q
MRCPWASATGSRRWTSYARGLGVLAASALLAALLELCPPVAAEAPAPAGGEAAALALDRKLITGAQGGSEIMTNLTYLSDVIGPRLTGSANLVRANEWAEEKMKGYGLSNVHLEAWELPVGWERGSASARIVEPDNGRSLTVASMGWAPGTNGKVTGDVVVLTARTPEDVKAYEGKLKGAIVLRGAPANVRPLSDMSMFFDRQQPARMPQADDEPAAPPNRPAAPESGGQAATPGPGRTANFDTRGNAEMMRFRREMADFLRKEGAAVMLLDSAKPHGLLDMTGGWRSQDRASAPDPLPTLFVTHEHYALLYRLATRPAPARTRVEMEVSNKFIPGPLAAYNTVGELRGSEKPDEYVVVGAHLDSWDLGQGTTDNGTGSCVVLETARVLAKSGARLRRTVRFVLFTGEEEGLYGSKAYVQQHKDDLPRVSAALVHDTGTGRIVGLTLQGREALQPIVEGELASLRPLGVVDVSTRSMGGSDHMSFEGAGVPGLMFRQDPAEYRLTHHSQSDTLDKAREPDLVQGAQVMAVLAARIADRDELLPRDKKEAAAEPRRP